MARSRKDVASGVLFIVGIISLVITTEERLWCLVVSVICLLLSGLLQETSNYGK